jgi:hypothetical protein
MKSPVYSSKKIDITMAIVPNHNVPSSSSYQASSWSPQLSLIHNGWSTFHHNMDDALWRCYSTGLKLEIIAECIESPLINQCFDYK